MYLVIGGLFMSHVFRLYYIWNSYIMDFHKIHTIFYTFLSYFLRFAVFFWQLKLRLAFTIFSLSFKILDGNHLRSSATLFLFRCRLTEFRSNFFIYKFWRLGLQFLPLFFNSDNWARTFLDSTFFAIKMKALKVFRYKC